MFSFQGIKTYIIALNIQDNRFIKMSTELFNLLPSLRVRERLSNGLTNFNKHTQTQRWVKNITANQLDYELHTAVCMCVIMRVCVRESATIC